MRQPGLKVELQRTIVQCGVYQGKITLLDMLPDILIICSARNVLGCCQEAKESVVVRLDHLSFLTVRPERSRFALHRVHIQEDLAAATSGETWPAVHDLPENLLCCCLLLSRHIDLNIGSM